MKKIRKIIAVCICCIFTFESLLSAAPHPLEGITLSPEKGEIVEHYTGTDERSLVLIKDAHNSAEAQLHISSLIDSLTSHPLLQTNTVIGTEGASHAYDLHTLHTFPEKEARNTIATEYVTDGMLTGVEHAGITAQKPLTIHGIEDEDLLRENYNAFKKLAAHERALEKELQHAYSIVALLKESFLSKTLFAFDKQKEAFLRGALTAEHFIPHLIELANLYRLDTRAYPVFSRLIETIHNTPGSTAQTTFDRRSIVTLTHEASKIAQTVSFRMARTAKERHIISVADYLSCLTHFLTRKARPDEVSLMQKKLPEYTPQHIEQTIQRLIQQHPQSDSLQCTLAIAQDCLPAAYRFYAAVAQRDHAFVENILETMDQTNSEKAIMVVGGYHTPHITKRLQERSISHITIQPTISEHSTPVPFEKRMDDSHLLAQHSIGASHFQASLFSHVVGIDQKEVLTDILSDMYGLLLLDKDKQLNSLAHIENRVTRLSTSENPVHTLLAKALTRIRTDLETLINNSKTKTLFNSHNELRAFQRTWGNTLRAQIHFESFERLFLKELTDIVALLSRDKEARALHLKEQTRIAPENIFEEFYYQWALTHAKLPIYINELKPLVQTIQSWDATSAQRITAVRELQKKHFEYSIGKSVDKKGHIDLHAHTIHSNGVFTPAHLVFEYWLQGFSALAITDKNSYAGLEEGLIIGEILGFNVIPGIEVPVRIQIGPNEFTNIHTLVYWHKSPSAFRAWLKDPENTAFLETIAKAQRHTLDQKKQKISEILIAFNNRYPSYYLSEEDLLAYAYDSVTKSKTLARALLAKYGPGGTHTLPFHNLHEISRRLIKPLKIAHLFSEHTYEYVIPFDQLVEAVHTHPFRIVFAHPLRNTKWALDTVEQILTYPGLDTERAFTGVELYHSRTNKEENIILRGIIDSLNASEQLPSTHLVQTTGSDTFGHLNKKYGVRSRGGFFTNDLLRLQFLESARMLPFKHRAHYYTDIVVHASKHFPDVLTKLIEWGTDEQLGKPYRDTYITLTPAIIDLLVSRYNTDENATAVQNILYALLDKNQLIGPQTQKIIAEFLGEQLTTESQEDVPEHTAPPTQTSRKTAHPLRALISAGLPILFLISSPFAFIHQTPDLLLLALSGVTAIALITHLWSKITMVSDIHPTNPPTLKKEITEKHVATTQDYFWFHEKGKNEATSEVDPVSQPTEIGDLFANEIEQIESIQRTWPQAACVFGGGAVKQGSPLYKNIQRIGTELRRRGIGCRTGTGPGTMEAPLIPYEDDDPLYRQGININNFPVNDYIGSAYNFSQFGPRKRAFYEQTIGAIICPGGIGTLDELFECIEQNVPFILFERSYWEPIIDNFCSVAQQHGFDLDRNAFVITDSVTEAVDYIIEHRYTGHTPEQKGFAGLQKSLWDGIDVLQTLPASVVFMGEAAAHQIGMSGTYNLVSRLVHQRTPVRAGSNGAIFECITSFAADLPLREYLQSTVYFSPDEADKMESYLSQFGDAVHYFATDDLSVHHVLSTENTHAFIFRPGGKKTLTNLLDVVANMQLGTIARKPVILLDKEFWHSFLDPFFERALNHYKEYGFSLIKPHDTTLCTIVDTAEEALAVLNKNGINTDYKHYSNIIHDKKALFGIDAIISDFDGVVYNYGDKEVSDSIRALQKNILAAGIRYITITGRPLYAFINAYGSEADIAALASDTPYVALTNAGAQAHTFGGDTVCSPIETFPPIELEATAAALLQDAFIDSINEVLAPHGMGWDTIEGIYGRIHLPYDFNVYLKTEELQTYRDALAQTLKNKITELKEKKRIPQNVEVVVTRASVDILVRSKATAVLEMIRRHALRKIVIIGDSVGTDEMPGNDRSLLSLSQNTARAAGIPWWKDLEIIRVYVGNEEDADIPHNVIRAPKGRFDSDAAFRILKHVAELHQEQVDWSTIPEYPSLLVTLSSDEGSAPAQIHIESWLAETTALTFATVKSATAHALSQSPALLHKFKTGELTIVRSKERSSLPKPFILQFSDADFTLSVYNGSTVYIMEDLFEITHIGVIEALCDPVLYERFNPRSQKQREVLIRTLQSAWAIRKGLSLPGPAHFYAQTCEYLLSDYFDIDFRHATAGVLDPVVRSAWQKIKVILHFLKEENWELIEDAIRIHRTEQWIDAVMKKSSGERTALLIHQGYFHEASPLSETAESIWRFGAGTEELAVAYIHQAQQALALDTTEKATQIKEALIEVENKLTIGTESIIRRRRKALYALRQLMKNVDISFNYGLSKNINMTIRMLRPGWLDSIVKRINAGTFKKNGNGLDSVTLVIDTQFDRVREKLSNPKTRQTLLSRNDPLSSFLAEAYKTDTDLIWDLVQKRFSELIDHYVVPNIEIRQLKSLIHLPGLDSEASMREELNTFMHDEALPISQELSSGILYARYCGLLLELVAAAYFADNDYEIISAGKEITNDEGIYLTELDLIVRDQQSQEMSIVEVKSMRSSLNMRMILNSKVRYKLETYREKRALIEKQIGHKIDSVKFVIDVGHQHYVQTFLQSNEAALEKEYGFPVTFIPLSMGTVVEEYTGFTHDPKKKKAPTKVDDAKSKRAKRREKDQKKRSEREIRLTQSDHTDRHHIRRTAQLEKRTKRREARSLQRSLIKSLHGIVEPALNIEINRANLFRAEDMLNEVLAGREEICMAVNEPALETHERRMIHHFTAVRGIQVVSTEDLLTMKETVINATRFVYVGITEDETTFPRTVRQPDAQVFLGADKTKRTLLLSNFPLLINALLSTRGTIDLDGDDGIFTDLENFIAQIETTHMLEDLHNEISENTFRQAA